MALAAVEDERLHQAGFPRREHLHLLTVPEQPLGKDTFFSKLDPRQNPPSDAFFDTPLSVGFLQPSIQEMLRVAASPELRTVNSGEHVLWERNRYQGRIEKQQVALGSSGVIEVGRNRFLNPRDMQTYAGPMLWGDSESVPDLYPNLKVLNEAGKLTTSSEHTHPDHLLPMLTIPDMSMFLVSDDQGNAFLNFQGVYGYDAEVYAFRTENTLDLLPLDQVEIVEGEWQNAFDAAGGSTRKRWEEALEYMSGERYLREKAQFDAFVQPYEDEITAEYARQLQIKFLLSTDGVVANAEDPGEIISIVRKQRALGDRQIA